MKLKRALAMFLTLVMALALAVPAAAAKPVKNSSSSGPATVYLKGEQSGTEFDYNKECWSTWRNVIFLGGAGENSTDEEVSAWHLVYTDKKGINNDLKDMRLVFDSGHTYNWTWDDGLSTNGSGNNPGWMVVAPKEWGKIDVAESYIKTTSSKNVQFNISGYYEAGTKPEEPELTPVSATIEIQKQIEGYSKFYASFTFQLLDAEGKVVDTITTDKQTGLGSKTVTVVPGTYTIREVLTDGRFADAADQTVVITADENASYEVTFVNKLDEGETSTVFQITKDLNQPGNPGIGFEFGIYADDTLIATMTSDEDGIAETEDFWIEPGTYTIREINLDTETYEENNKVITVVVDDKGNYVYTDADGKVDDGIFINYEYGSLDVHTPTVMEKYDELWHTPIYEASKKETKVSRVVSDLPSWIRSERLRNGFTLLWLDKEKLAAEQDGVNIRIAYSDPSNSLCPDIAPENPWDDPTPATYNLRIVDGKLIVTSTLPDFGFAVYGPEDTVKGNADFGKFGPKHDSEYDFIQNGYYVKSWDVPNVNDEGNFRFYIHYDVGYETSNVTGCNPDDLITREMEREYAGEVTVTVTNEAGETVTGLTKLPHGEYTVTVTAADQVEPLYKGTVTVNPGEETKVTFDGPLYLTGKGEPVYKCANPECPLKTP